MLSFRPSRLRASSAQRAIMSEPKTDYFGSFLDAMRTSSTSLGVGKAAQRTATSHQGGATPTSAADAVLQILLEREGKAEVPDLLPATNFSVGSLIETL